MAAGRDCKIVKVVVIWPWYGFCYSCNYQRNGGSMKATKLVVFLIIAALLGGGFYFFQKDKQKKLLVAHNQQRFQQITEVAQKSDAAGLLEMVSAINTYHKLKGAYPEKLIQLYPEFIPDKSFISSLNWRYSPGKGTYLIKRSLKGKLTYSSMGPDMRLKTGSDKPTSSFEQVAVSDTPKKSMAVQDAKTQAGVKKETKKDLAAPPVVPTKIMKPVKLTTGNTERAAKRQPQITIVKTELNTNEKFLLSLDRYNLYIWKTHEGILGFSDTQYPDERKLTIYKDQGWIEYQKNKTPSQQK